MKKFTIEQAYNCCYWRTVRVQANTLEEALTLAYEAEEDYDYHKLAKDEAGVTACGDWSADGGGAECGPTFTTQIARGYLDESVSWAIHNGAKEVPVPESDEQFAIEWPNEHHELRQLRQYRREYLQRLDIPRSIAWGE